MGVLISPQALYLSTGILEKAQHFFLEKVSHSIYAHALSLHTNSVSYLDTLPNSDNYQNTLTRTPVLIHYLSYYRDPDPYLNRVPKITHWLALQSKNIAEL